MTGVVWNVENPAGRLILGALFWVGWLIVFYSTFLINHFDLFGLRQVYLYDRYAPIGFRTPVLYRVVRHPLMLGFIIAFWATPRMTVGHLLFAAVTTVYILVAIQLEERDMIKAHGDDYRRYMQEASMILPLPKRKALKEKEKVSA
jgi:protein-S-isoprenylcysteine O-methyltransferase Ste14